MGYRSDVVLVMYPERPEDMPALKLFAQENLPEGFEEKTRNSRRVPSYLRCRWDNVKWYDSYPDVQQVEEMMAKCEDMFRDESNNTYMFHYEFVRTGEEIEDVEERGTYNLILRVSRVIEED